MHISNGIINGPVSLAYLGVAIALLAVCLSRSRQDLSDRLAPMAGLVAAFIFAVQMLNFPVLPGVSGHLLGGALAATLVGPWVGALCVSVVLIVQALVFADGGLSALGLNISNMALLGTAVGYLVVVGLMKLLPRSAFGVGAAVFAASVVSVVFASQGFVVQYALGGEVPLTIGYGEISAVMAGVHALIGLGEGTIAALAVVAVAKVRPDLVYALRGERLDGQAQASPKRLVVAGLFTALVLAAAPAGAEGEEVLYYQPLQYGEARHVTCGWEHGSHTDGFNRYATTCPWARPWSPRPGASSSRSSSALRARRAPTRSRSVTRTGRSRSTST